jgi:hypothetical protein
MLIGKSSLYFIDLIAVAVLEILVPHYLAPYLRAHSSVSFCFLFSNYTVL